MRGKGVLIGAMLTGLTVFAGTASAAIGSEGIGDPYYPADGNGGYDVANYDVTVKYDPGSKVLQSDTTVTATATEELDRFNLDLQGLTVDSVQVDGAAAGFTRSGEHELVITPAEPVRKGREFRVRVRYEGKPAWPTTPSGGAFSFGEPHAAAFWYPANDHPSDKATFRLTATVPDGWGVVSNGYEGPVDHADGRTTFRWSADQPQASYLSVIAIDRWEIERLSLPDGTPVLNAYGPGTKQHARPLEERLPEVIEFLSAKFGRYPFRTAGGIFVDAGPDAPGLETQTRPIYANGASLPLTEIVHEIAHQWYGDSVSVRWWRDICLNECFASYAQWLWAEEKEGADLDARYRTELEKQKANPKFWANKLYDAGPSYMSGVYDKGPLAVHALRRTIGDAAFTRLLRDWPALHRDGNAEWPQLEKLAEQVSGQDLSGFFTAWFRGNTIPPDHYLLHSRTR